MKTFKKTTRKEITELDTILEKLHNKADINLKIEIRAFQRKIFKHFNK